MSAATPPSVLTSLAAFLPGGVVSVATARRIQTRRDDVRAEHALIDATVDQGRPICRWVAARFRRRGLAVTEHDVAVTSTDTGARISARYRWSYVVDVTVYWQPGEASDLAEWIDATARHISVLHDLCGRTASREVSR